MAKAKEKRAPITNPMALNWPQDILGMTSQLRRELARAIGRIQGDPARQKLFMETLEVGKQYAEDKLDAAKNRKELAETRRKEREALKAAASREAVIRAAKAKRKQAESDLQTAAAMEKSVEGDK